MLEDLRTRIRTLPTYRYFSSSLLVLYDGAECPEGLRRLEGAPRDNQEFERIIERAKKADDVEIDYSSENQRMVQCLLAQRPTVQYQTVTSQHLP